MRKTDNIDSEILCIYTHTIALHIYVHVHVLHAGRKEEKLIKVDIVLKTCTLMFCHHIIHADSVLCNTLVCFSAH